MAHPEFTPTVALRFWSKVFKSQQPSECWVWMGARNHKGYGRFSTSHQHTFQSHRIAWMLCNGPIPAGMCVCHHCDNPPCCNPAHLFIGTVADNQADMKRKGRATGPKNPVRGSGHYAHQHPELVLRGSKCGMAKLSESLVSEIRDRYSSRTVSMYQLGREYGVARTLIGMIIHRKIWRHVP